VDTFNGRMLDTALEIVEVLAKTDFAHDVEAEKHAPRRHVQGLAVSLEELRLEEVGLRLDARLIGAER
jgi:hypothetical protein